MKNRTVRKFMIALAAMALFGAWTPDASAREASRTQGPYYAGSEGELRVRKLMRGLANVTLGVFEIPNHAFMEAYRTTPISGAIRGSVKGLVKGAKRMLIGVWEVATFYAPMKNNYEPYIEPEVVLMEHTG